MAWMGSRTWSCVGEGGSVGGEEGVLGLLDILASLNRFSLHPFSFPPSPILSFPNCLWGSRIVPKAGLVVVMLMIQLAGIFNNKHLHRTYHRAGTVARVSHAFIQ